MMGAAHYSAEQLLKLRQSPLVRKPDGLPSIEHWMDAPQDHTQKKGKSQGSRLDDHTLAPEHLSRPSLLQTRHTSKGSSAVSEGIVLGPPKVSFASASRNLNKTTNTTDRQSQQPHEDQDETEERSNVREKFFRERDADRKRDRPAPTNGRRGGREDHESWTSGRSRRINGEDDTGNGIRSGDANDNRIGEEEGAEAGADLGPRKNGPLKSKSEHAWGREDLTSAGRDQNGSKGGTRGQGWRDKDKREERDWNRPTRVEQDPEWMDTGAKDDKKQVHTQEEFQRWKERMKAGAAASEDKSTSISEATVTKETATSIPPTPLALEGGFDKITGAWGEAKRAETKADGGQGPKTQGQKSKPSRFAGFFAPQEEHPQTSPEAPGSPSAGVDTNGTNEDKEGFQRILQMLGGAAIGSQAAVPPTLFGQLGKGGMNGNSSSMSEVLLPPPIEAFEHAHSTVREGGRPLDARPPPSDRYAMLGEQGGNSRGMHHRLDIQGQNPNLDLQPGPAINQGPLRHPNNIREQPMMGPGNSAEPLNVQRLLGQHLPSLSSPVSRDREFLFNLMQQSSNPSTALQSRLRQPLEDIHLGIPPEGREVKPQVPKSRGPPPGLFDERGYAENGFQRRDLESTTDSLKKIQQRAPPGFTEDMPAIQRRNTDHPPRHQMGIPLQPNLDQLYMKPNPNTHQHERIQPPPGFGAGMRQPTLFPAQSLPFPSNNGPQIHPGIQRGVTGPAALFQHQMPPGPPGLFPGPPPPLGFPPGAPMPDGMMGTGHLQQGGGARRMQFDNFAEMAQVRPSGRGAAPGQFGS